MSNILGLLLAAVCAAAAVPTLFRESRGGMRTITQWLRRHRSGVKPPPSREI